MKTITLILTACLLLSCEKTAIKPIKNKPVSIGGNTGNYYYGYTILATVDTIKDKK